MSFCPKCGEIIQLNASFCYHCNSNLTPLKNNVNTLVKNIKESSNTYNLGINLENFVEDTILRTGYINTEKRKRIQGMSGTMHEIDIMAYNKRNTVAIECKNYTIPVGIKEIRDFKSKLNDLPHISEGIFVTNSKFTSEAANYANYNKIRLWDGETLSKIHYLASIGRLNEKNDSDGIEHKADNENDEIIISNALPVLIQYDLLKKIKLVNPQKASITQAELIFFPFYLLKFTINAERDYGMLGMKEKYTDNESYKINAIDGEILSKRNLDMDVKPFLFSKIYKNEIEESVAVNEQIRDYEKTLIIETIENTPPIQNYSIKKNRLYNIVVHSPNYPIEAAERKIVEDIVERRKVDYDNVSLSEYSEVYVPKWSIIIKTDGLIYKRESIASANSIFRDEIDLCPKDTGKDIRKTYAICQICGMAICSKHAIKDNDKYSCSDHETSYDNDTSNKLEEKIKDLSTSLNSLKTLFKQKK